MVYYPPNKTRGKMAPFDCPFTPGAQIRFSTRLGFGVKNRVRADALRTETRLDSDGNEEEVWVFNPMAAQGALVKHVLLAPDTIHNFDDEAGKRLVIDEFWIDTGFDENDAEAFGFELFRMFRSAIGFEESLDEIAATEPERAAGEDDGGMSSPATEPDSELTPSDSPLVLEKTRKRTSRSSAMS